MQTRAFFVALVLAQGVTWAATCARAETWQGQLEGGGVIQVDPMTRKPTYYYNGGSAPLWDGVHQLSNGSVVIVRDGVVVPDERMYNTWTMEEAQDVRSEVPVCDQLVRKVCGFNSECFGNQPCGIALQLKKLEEEESDGAPGGQASAAVQECRKGLSDVALFPVCEKRNEDEATPCAELVLKVCGNQGQCAKAPACDPARQLLVMENKERLHSEDPNAETASGTQCKEAKGNEFFVKCAVKANAEP